MMGECGGPGIFTGFLISIAVAMAGCGSLVLQANKLVNPGSKYQPTLATSGDVDEYIKLIQATSNTPVSDELGTYFHSTDGQFVDEIYLNIIEDGVLRSVFTDAVGLVAPVYAYTAEQGRYRLEVDWNATQRRHATFSKETKLNILSLDATKRYLAALEAQSLRKGAKVYDHNSPSLITKQAGLSADYMIWSDIEELYSKDFSRPNQTNGFLANVGDLRIAKYHMTDKGGAFIYFVPLALYENAGKGRYHAASRCGSLNTIPYKKMLEETGKRSAIPLFKVTEVKTKSNNLSDLRRAGAEAEAKEVPQAIQAYLSAMQDQDKAFIKGERACVNGLNGLRVSGAFGSQKLK